MRTLYIRNVPDDMAEAFIELARREGMSVNAFVLRELGHVARRADNRALVASWPSYDVSADEIAEDIRAERNAS